MSLTNDDVLKILDIIDRSDYDDVRIEIGNLKLHVQKHGTNALEMTEEPPQLREKNGSNPMGTVHTQRGDELPAASKGHTVAEESKPEGMVEITAPMLGTFYRAPSPGERPFVEVGDRVGPSDTLCLVEVMKLFNSIKADVAGTVMRIVVSNGSMVEYGQTLMLIKPDQASSTRSNEFHGDD